MTIYIYDESGTLECTKDMKVKHLNNSIKNAIYGTKGYGWYKDKYYSKHPVVIMNREQEKEYFDIWLSANYELLWNKYANLKEFNEDVFNDTILYMYKEIAKPRGINNYFNQFNWKLKRMKIDNYRKVSNLRKHEVNNIVTDEFDYIQDVGSRIIDKDYNCIDDVNTTILSRSLGEYVVNKFGEIGYAFIDYYANHLTGREKGGQRKIAKKYNLNIFDMNEKFKEILDHVNSDQAKDQINELFEVSKFFTLDDYTLTEVINY